MMMMNGVSFLMLNGNYLEQRAEDDGPFLDMYRLGRKQELKRRFKYCKSTQAKAANLVHTESGDSFNRRLRGRFGKYLAGSSLS
jgi:hypothetical protein